MPVHPYIGRPMLEWKRVDFGYEANILRLAKYRSDNTYSVREVYAYVRRKDASDELLLPIFDSDDTDKAWLVLKNTFGDIKSFDKFKDAKLHVEALFALEFGD